MMSAGHPDRCRPPVARKSAGCRANRAGAPAPKVFRDRVHTGDWRVEKLDEDGETTEVAIFSGGGDARQRAIRYADREYGAFDEIELEPYARSP
jgi:hypothetical protein